MCLMPCDRLRKAGVYAVGVRVMVGCLVAVYNFRFLTLNSKHPSLLYKQFVCPPVTPHPLRRSATTGDRLTVLPDTSASPGIENLYMSETIYLRSSDSREEIGRAARSIFFTAQFRTP